jgi:hypothetical protein
MVGREGASSASQSTKPCCGRAGDLLLPDEVAHKESSVWMKPVIIGPSGVGSLLLSAQVGTHTPLSVRATIEQKETGGGGRGETAA